MGVSIGGILRFRLRPSGHRDYCSRSPSMLVLSRKVGERILIGDHIAVTVVRVGQGMVRIGVEAPRDYSILREEVKDRQATANTSEGEADPPPSPAE